MNQEENLILVAKGHGTKRYRTSFSIVIPGDIRCYLEMVARELEISSNTFLGILIRKLMRECRLGHADFPDIYTVQCDDILAVIQELETDQSRIGDESKS